MHPKISRHFLSLWILGLLWLIAPPASIAETVQWQGYDIHYTTFKSTLIPAEVAAAHNINRSKRRILTNITVRKNNTAVAARISGNTTNLLGQVFELQFEAVREPFAIYYLASLIVDEADTLRFVLEIKPAGADAFYPLKFTRQYF